MRLFTSTPLQSREQRIDNKTDPSESRPFRYFPLNGIRLLRDPMGPGLTGVDVLYSFGPAGDFELMRAYLPICLWISGSVHQYLVRRS
jgi:hypothetical protein